MDYFSIFLSRQQVKEKWVAMKNQLCVFCNPNAVEGIEMPALHPNQAARPAKPDQRAEPAQLAEPENTGITWQNWDVISITSIEKLNL